jgi:D-alanine-D-alanine ligase
MQQLRVGVFMGGKSIEREVSFNSGRTVCDHLDAMRYTVVPIFQTARGHLCILPSHFIHRGKIADFEHRLEREAQWITWDELKGLIDFAYLALHGRYGEDGTIQGFLELLGIPYFGSKVFASALGMNKIVQKDFLRAAGITVPRDVAVQEWQVARAVANSEPVVAQLREAGISFPVIVKPVCEGSSLGVSKVHDAAGLAPAINAAATITQGRVQAVLIEECIMGMEFSCIVITGKDGQLQALPPTEIVVENTQTIFEYDQKYMPGRATKYTPARCSAEALVAIQEACMATMRAIGFSNVGRMDGFLTSDNKIYIIDPNSLTGMGPASHLFMQAAEVGLSHVDLINHFIETELRYYGAHQGETV